MAVPESAAEAPAHLLVVDDNPANRYVLSNWLQRAGHTVVEAADGAAALAALHDPGVPLPELAIVDVRLPDMSGFEVCEHIKATPRTAGIPVIHVSATAIATHDRTQGLYRGADAYLTEPIAPTELLATVTAALRYSRARNEAERLTERIRRLHQATLDVYAAPDTATLVAAAARGAFGLTDGDALVVAQGALEEHVLLAHHGGRGRTEPRPCVPSLLMVLAAQALPNAVGVALAEFTRPEWRALCEAAGAPALASLLDTDVLAVVARARAGEPPICVLVARDTAGRDEARTMLTQYGQAVALALEARRTYAEEHSLAVTLQRALLPAALPSGRVDLAVRYLPASRQNEVGGDFYDAFHTPDGLLLAVGDVAGHSLDAAIVMGALRHALRAYALEGHSLQRLLVRLDAIFDHEWPTWTATLCLVRIDPDRRTIEVANAGHIPPLLAAPGEEPRYLECHGPLLGVQLHHPEATVHPIPPGSHVVLITDGLVETRRGNLNRALDVLADVAAPATGADDLCDRVLAHFGLEHDDDVVVFAAHLTDPDPTEGTPPPTP